MAYEMRISDWSSDVCSSDLPSVIAAVLFAVAADAGRGAAARAGTGGSADDGARPCANPQQPGPECTGQPEPQQLRRSQGATHWRRQIGRASCRERACQSVKISLDAGYLKKKQTDKMH